MTVKHAIAASRPALFLRQSLGPLAQQRLVRQVLLFVAWRLGAACCMNIDAVVVDTWLGCPDQLLI